MLIQLETQCSKPKPRSVFYSYSHKDEDLRDELDTHLKLLKRDGFISTWHDRKIRPGDEWDHVINENLNTAEVILFLVSHHFLASQYCRDIEVKRAMERYQKREGILIPIILKPCVWTSEEFARLQVLPKNCRPLAEWPDSGFAQVAEELRTMLVDMLYPQKPSEATGGQHGNWIIKMLSRPDVDSKTRAQTVVARLREYTEDFTISLQATAATQIMDGEKAQVGLMLILTGTPEAFGALDKAQREGRLAPAIDEDILSLYVIYGATVQGSSTVGASMDIADVEGHDLLVRPSAKVTPCHIRGLYLPKGETGELEFMFHRGDTLLSERAQQANFQQLLDYCVTALAVKDEFQWVNLSAYEADRMLPKELSGTAMGRNLLSQDCMLKQLTASFMHPDSPVGREYWDAVYAEARRIFGTSKMPFRSFQKVWVKPIKAQVYETDTDADLGPDCPIAVRPNNWMVFLLDSELDVQCEEDLVALKHNGEQRHDLALNWNKEAGKSADFSLDIFRQIVLPRLKEEVNEGEHFAELRRIYSAMLFATWLKTCIHLTQHKDIHRLADSGDPRLLNCVITGIRPAAPFQASEQAQKTSASPKEAWVIQHSQPTAPAFDIPENVEFFGQYIRLFKNGVFRCARSEAGDSPDERIIRVYFSGAIDFRNLRHVVESRSLAKSSEM